jgi:integrase
VRQVAHHAALPYDEISAFLAALRGHQAVAARALELGILTATRTSEFLLARWGEVDLGNRVWTIPAERMKARREHRVPLAPAAIALLEALAPGDVEDFVFRGGGELAAPIGKPLSNMAALMLLRRMGRGDLTVHGFRSTFRDWAAERTNFPAEVAEMALAHTIADKVEAAYRRGDLFDKRRQLMEAWARFCGTPAGAGTNITPLRRIAT